jgi:hypothetical protein
MVVLKHTWQTISSIWRRGVILPPVRRREDYGLHESDPKLKMGITELIVLTEMGCCEIEKDFGVWLFSRLVESINEEISHDTKDFGTQGCFWRQSRERFHPDLSKMLINLAQKSKDLGRNLLSTFHSMGE